MIAVINAARNADRESWTTMACLIWFARSVVIVNQAAVLRDKNESAPVRSEMDD